MMIAEKQKKYAEKFRTKQIVVPDINELETLIEKMKNCYNCNGKQCKSCCRKNKKSEKDCWSLSQYLEN